MEEKQGKTIWFTGLSGSGKSTLSSMLKSLLEARGVPVVLLDGDVLRKGLNRDLGFSALDRAENIRRAAEVAKILSDAGHTVISAFITPLESLRTAVRGIFQPGRYVEIFLDCPLSVCEERDAKGLYARARSGQLREFTGVSAPFEPPTCAEVIIPTDKQGLEESLAAVVTFLEERFPDLHHRAPCEGYGTRAGRGRRVALIGLDGITPGLLFGDSAADLPNLQALMECGVWGPLRCTDASSWPAPWASLTTGKDSTELNLSGGHGQSDKVRAGVTSIAGARVWEYLEDLGRTAMLLNVPYTYPPAARRGVIVAGPPMPTVDAPATHPGELASEIRKLTGGAYRADVDGDHDRASLLEQLHRMIESRFRVACHLVEQQPWDLFMMVEVAAARLRSALCRPVDPGDSLTMNNGRPERALAEFCGRVDAWVGSLLARLCDETTVVVASAHGAHIADSSEGIFVMTRMSDFRRGVKRGRRIEEASVLDITPTIFHEFGLAVPSGVGGMIISVEEPDNKHVVLAGDCGGGGAGGGRGRFSGCSSEQGDLIRNRLGRLGYF